MMIVRIMYENFLPNSKKTQLIPFAKIILLIRFRKTHICSDNHMNPMDIQWTKCQVNIYVRRIRRYRSDM